MPNSFFLLNYILDGSVILVGFFFQLSEMLDIDLSLVKNAVSVFCRLGFAKKRVTGLENLALHVTWASHMVLPEYAYNFLWISRLRPLF